MHKGSGVQVLVEAEVEAGTYASEQYQRRNEGFERMSGSAALG